MNNSIQGLPHLSRQECRGAALCYHIQIIVVPQDRLAMSKMLSHQPLNTIARHGTPNPFAYSNPQARPPQTVPGTHDHEIFTVKSLAVSIQPLEVASLSQPFFFEKGQSSHGLCGSSHSQTFSPLRTPALDHLSPLLRRHSGQESMIPCTFKSTRLIGPFHNALPFFEINHMACSMFGLRLRMPREKGR